MAFVVIQQTPINFVDLPESGKLAIFVDSSDGQLKTKDALGNVKTIGGSVQSVAGRTGAIVLGQSDITGLAESLASKSSKSELSTEVQRAETAESAKLAKGQNLSDLTSSSTARSNLGVMSVAEVEALVGTKGGVNKAEVEALAKELGVAVFNVTHYGAKGLGSGNESPGCQAAIEAAEAAGGGLVYFPPTANYYRLEEKLTYKLSKQIHFLGSYQAAEIRLVKDLEFGEPVIGERGTEEALGSPNIKHTFTALHLVGPKKWPTSPTGTQLTGYTPAYAAGLECCGNSIVKECHVEGFYCGYLCREFGQKFIDCVDVVNLYGTYIAPNNLRQPFIKGGVFRERHESFPLFARLAVHPSFITEGSTFSQEGGSNEPYYFYKEAPNGVSGGFIQAAHTDSFSSQATGNAVIYDENCASSLPAAYYKEPIAFRIHAIKANMINYPSTRIGNTQLLDLSGASAGTFKITLPAQKASGAGAGNQFAGATTAAIAYNASNSTIQTALNAVVGSESTAAVSTREGKKQILLSGKAALMAGTAMTLDTSSLTGSGSLGPLEIDPGMGPLVRPCAARIATVKNATGGTFTLTATVNGVPYTTAAIAYNATPQVVAERLYKAMGHPFGVVVGSVSENGKYYLFFNGRSLNKTVSLSANTTNLVGVGAEVAFTEGASAQLALRHAEYMVDCGDFEPTFLECPFAMECGTVGFMRTKGELRGEVRERVVDQLIAEIATGEMILAELGGSNRSFYMFSKGSAYRLLSVTGEVKKHTLLGVNGGQNAVIYPTAGGIPAAGYATATVPAATTRRIPVRTTGSGSTNGSDVVEPEFTGSTPTINSFLKPSTTEAGKVVAGLFSDYVIGIALAGGSGGKVKLQPRNLT